MTIYEKAPCEIREQLYTWDRKKRVVVIDLEITLEDLTETPGCAECGYPTQPEIINIVSSRGLPESDSETVAVAVNVPVYMCVNERCGFLTEAGEGEDPFYFVPTPVVIELTQKASMALEAAGRFNDAYLFEQEARRQSLLN